MKSFYQGLLALALIVGRGALAAPPTISAEARKQFRADCAANLTATIYARNLRVGDVVTSDLVRAQERNAQTKQWLVTAAVRRPELGLVKLSFRPVGLKALETAAANPFRLDATSTTVALEVPLQAEDVFYVIGRTLVQSVEERVPRERRLIGDPHHVVSLAGGVYFTECRRDSPAAEMNRCGYRRLSLNAEGAVIAAPAEIPRTPPVDWPTQILEVPFERTIEEVRPIRRHAQLIFLMPDAGNPDFDHRDGWMDLFSAGDVIDIEDHRFVVMHQYKVGGITLFQKSDSAQYNLWLVELDAHAPILGQSFRSTQEKIEVRYREQDRVVYVGGKTFRVDLFAPDHNIARYRETPDLTYLQSDEVKALIRAFDREREPAALNFERIKYAIDFVRR